MLGTIKPDVVKVAKTSEREEKLDYYKTITTTDGSDTLPDANDWLQHTIKDYKWYSVDENYNLIKNTCNQTTCWT